MTSQLFSPFTMREMTLENRIVVSPMCQYSAEDGSATDWHLMHLGQYAVSGVALVITEATAVEPRGRITPGCVGLYSDENEEALARVMAFARDYGQAKMGIQLAHAGRKASCHRPWEGRHPLGEGEGAWQTVSSSDQPHDEGWHTPQALDKDGLAEVKAAWVQATERADRVGFDMIEMHMAHGYFFHQFLSPIANDRDDEYGGDLERRMRFPLEAFEAVRAAWPEEKPLGVRISTTDWVEGGWNPDEAVVLCRELKARGCDYICASSGGVSEQQKMILGEGYQVDFAEKIKREAEIPTMAVGMIMDPHHAESILAEGKAEMVALARGLLFDTHWAVTAAAALGDKATAPPQYIRGYDLDFLREMRGAPKRDQEAAE